MEHGLLASLQKARYMEQIPDNYDWRFLEESAHEHFAEYRNTLQKGKERENNALIDAHVAGLTQTHSARHSRLERLLSDATDPGIRSLRAGQIRNEQSRLQVRIDALESDRARGVSVSGNLVLAGYIRYQAR